MDPARRTSAHFSRARSRSRFYVSSQNHERADNPRNHPSTMLSRPARSHDVLECSFQQAASFPGHSDVGSVRTPFCTTIQGLMTLGSPRPKASITVAPSHHLRVGTFSCGRPSPSLKMRALAATVPIFSGSPARRVCDVKINSRAVPPGVSGNAR